MATGAIYLNDIVGNHTIIAMSVSSGNVTIKSGYSTVIAKVYAIS